MTIRVAAAALAGAAVLIAGCGGATQTPQAATEDETVVAHGGVVDREGAGCDGRHQRRRTDGRAT